MKKKKPFNCVTCAASFGLMQNLKRIHRGNKPFKCKLCNIALTGKNDLSRHISSVHEGKIPFKCDICDAKFSYKGNLIRHKSSVYERKKRS